MHTVATCQQSNMGRMCAVSGCGVSSSSNSGHSMHMFPPDGSIRRQWIHFVKTTRLDFIAPTKHQGICGQHFETECFEDRFIIQLKEQAGIRPRRKLKPDAIPTILTEKCLAMLSEKSPAACASRKRSLAASQTSVSERDKRTKKRELLKVCTTILKQWLLCVSCACS